MRPSSASSRNEAGPVRLEPLELWIERQPGPLRPQVLAALRQHGEPLRWAITAVAAQPVAGAAIGAPQGPGSAVACASPAAANGFGDPRAAGGAVATGQPCFDALHQADAAANPAENSDPSGQLGQAPCWLRLEAVMLR